MTDIVFAPFIRQWFARSKGERVGEFTIFDRFISLWFSFNAWGSSITGLAEDRKMIEALKNDKTLSESYSALSESDSEFRNDVTKLASYAVKDMRYPNDKKRDKTITNPESFAEVRCNLFHGKKSMEEPPRRGTRGTKLQNSGQAIRSDCQDSNLSNPLLIRERVRVVQAHAHRDTGQARFDPSSFRL